MDTKPPTDPNELQTIVKTLYDDITGTLASVFADITKQLSGLVYLFGSVAQEPKPTPAQLGEIGRAFDGRYPTVGEAFQTLQKSTRPAATSKWLLLISSHNLKATSRWHLLRRYRLRRYVAELEAVLNGQTGK